MWYPEWAVKVLFWPFTLVGFEAAWRIVYCLNVVSWIATVRKLPDNLWGECAYIISFHPMSILLGFNNVQPILIYLATFPLGAVLAGILKPYYFGVAILHAIGIGVAVYKRQAGRISHRTSPSRAPRLGEKGRYPSAPPARIHSPQVACALRNNDGDQNLESSVQAVKKGSLLYQRMGKNRVKRIA